MFKKILVPLDGSPLGNQVLQPVADLALPLQATVILLNVGPLPAGRTGGTFKMAAAFLSSLQLARSEEDLEVARHPVYREAEMASLESDAKAFLLPAAEFLRAQGVNVEIEVVFGRPAGGILQYAATAQVDLIIMSTHGEGGPSPWAIGPTTDRVTRRAPMPVMLIRPAEVTEMLPSLGKMEETNS